MSDAHRFAQRLKRLRADAQRAGLALVVDADSMAIRVMENACLRDADDLRAEGERVSVDGACGGPGNKFHIAASYSTTPKTRAQEAAADMRERCATTAEDMGAVEVARALRALPITQE